MSFDLRLKMIGIDLQVGLQLRNSVNLSFLKFVKNCDFYGQKSTFQTQGLELLELPDS